MSDYQIFELGNFVLRSGATLRDAKLAYKTYGTLNHDKSNAIVYPTWYSGQHYDNEWLIGEGMGLDPNKYFIIIPNMFGNGLSSSPSNTPPPYDKARFPNITFYDNVAAQHRLVTEHFGIERLPLVLGWSMGAGQTYQWAVSYPEMVERILPFCGSARTSVHNFVFLEAVKAAIQTDVAWNGGWYDSPPTKGLRAVGRVYAGWGLSQAFYREKLSEDRLLLARGFSGGLLGRLLPAERREQSAGDAVDVAERRHRSHTRFRRESRKSAGVDSGEGHRHAGRHRPVLPARGQRIRGRPHAERDVPPHSVDLGSLRGRRHQSHRHPVHRR
jgi:homoserine acetyltransferase